MWLLRSFTYAKLEERVIYLYVDCSSNSLVVVVRSFNVPFTFFSRVSNLFTQFKNYKTSLHLSCEDNSSSYDFPSYQGFWKQSSTGRKTFDSAKLFVLLSTKKKSAAAFTILVLVVTSNEWWPAKTIFSVIACYFRTEQSWCSLAV